MGTYSCNTADSIDVLKCKVIVRYSSSCDARDVTGFCVRIRVLLVCLFVYFADSHGEQTCPISSGFRLLRVAQMAMRMSLFRLYVEFVNCI